MKIGFGELLIVLVVVMLVIGPDKLPEFARKIGKALGEFRHATEDVSAELKENVLDPLDEAAAPIREAIEPIEEIKSSVNQNVREMQRNLGSVGRVSSRKKADTAQPAPEPAAVEEAASEKAAAEEAPANTTEPVRPEAVPAADPAEAPEAADEAAAVPEAPAPATQEETAPETVSQSKTESEE